MTKHHTSDYHAPHRCTRCGRLVGIHNWSKRPSRHQCGHVNPATGRKWMCDACPTCTLPKKTEAV